MCVHVHVCVCACVRAYVHACVYVCVLSLHVVCVLLFKSLYYLQARPSSSKQSLSLGKSGQKLESFSARYEIV